ncbi:MAG: diacylglycerol kinase family protein [Lachnospiraceae bacterium]|nr:diacylglycerol kinase family protein [Lachnospiraceae bacterium]
MAKYRILYNPFSGNCDWEKSKKVLDEIINGAKESYDVTKRRTEEVINEFADDDIIILVGGDGTLNHFVNDINCDFIPNPIYFYPTGTGNDFARDIRRIDKNKIVKVDKYLKHLPEVEVEERQYRFLNAIGFGLDGYCCEMGDQVRAMADDRSVNYAGIAIKGLLFKYEPTSATVTVDGEVHKYEKVWIASTTFGKYYGGGMILSSAQERGNKDHTCSLVVVHDSGRLSTMMAFPSIIKGKTEGNNKMVDIYTGHEIKVEFNKPRTIQIDGETILGVKEYTVKC